MTSGDVSRLVAVGECDPRGGPPLCRLGRGRSGDRLRGIMGLPDDEYDRLERVNLCRVAWSDAGAARAARRLLARLRPGRVVVALGRRVSAAIGAGRPFTVTAVGGVTVVSLPHPSGLCRTWNDRRSVARARASLRRGLARATTLLTNARG